MSMLIRYRKQGGFQQLLTLIETSAPAKREQLLGIIQGEDPGWAALLRTKMLTLERVFTWEPGSLAEVTNSVMPISLAAVLSSQEEDCVKKVLGTLAPNAYREVRGFLNDRPFSPSEAEAARVKIVSKVRELEREMKLNLDLIDPAVSTKNLRVA